MQYSVIVESRLGFGARRAVPPSIIWVRNTNLRISTGLRKVEPNLCPCAYDFLACYMVMRLNYTFIRTTARHYYTYYIYIIYIYPLKYNNRHLQLEFL